MAQDDGTLKAWLDQGPFVLALSSGFFGFYAHCGMLTALEDAGIEPDGYAGSSAGALIAGFRASGMGAKYIAKTLNDVRLEDFWDPAPGLGLLRGRAFRKILDRLLLVDTFEQCEKDLWVSAFDILGWRTRVFKEGPLAQAIHASCAVPIMFHPVWIDHRPYLDGGVQDRPGLSGVAQTRRVFLHHLSSQSPWRLEPPAIPQRANLGALVIDGLAQVNPFALDRGFTAFQKAYAATTKALNRPLVHGVVRVGSL
jgi:NTE family protein